MNRIYLKGDEPKKIKNKPNISKAMNKKINKQMN